MAIEVFNRYESKYLLSGSAYRRLYLDLMEHMELDEYNKKHEFYSISNIYFDTEHHSLIRASIQKPKYKEKLRLRAYGVPEQNAKVYLEIKKKVLGLVNKRRTALKLDEAYEFVRTGQAPELQDYMNKQVMNEISYFLRLYNLEPKVYISYDRKALFSKESRDLRITFDTNIRCRRYDLRLEQGDYGDPLLQENQWLMEVKAEKTVPLWLSRLLSEHGLYRTGFSKYGNEYKNQIRNERTEQERILYA
ncbi:polyphosphate polymerase domain-containing protein [Paenibacillus sp. JX-17]|uniref:Polyphosphate polymerase domain-containing protein n=1 Tax=Paenibacillus lacisoli TaxID=3064525 RepID=A0ABT9CAJ5_9BACL|nr:polyphosphate polymerase domain-containing protein [Paenibacillus sp. JX-17]MDO7906284.1 polyphosphate polymerase domain-containing protein [Paenibacillus sp. JX-17]